MQKVKISGLGVSLPKSSIVFEGGIRYRISEDETHLGLLVESAKNALKDADMSIEDIDCIIGACAFGLQPLPCTAALVHEQIAKHLHIPAFDVDSTCTSFITALDLISYQIDFGKYKNVLIVSGDLSSIALNEQERHSFELFSDGCISAVISKSDNENHGIMYSKQLTYSTGAHLTEVYGGGTTLSPHQMNNSNVNKYKFHMEGKNAIVLALTMTKDILADMIKNSGIAIENIDFIIPHQASAALDSIMKRLNIPSEKYMNIVYEYGNMVSGSIPFTLYKAIERKRVKRGDTLLLIGTAAGMTINAMLIKY